METKTCKILSINAWRNDCGWDWNNWYKIGEITTETLDSLKTNRQLLKHLRKVGILSDYSKGRVAVEDDQYNVVITDKNTNEPLFAIEYGNQY